MLEALFPALSSAGTALTIALLACSSHFIIFSGGMPRASYGDRHCVSVLQGQTLVTLDFTSRVIDFFTVHNTEAAEGGMWPTLCTPEAPSSSQPSLTHSAALSCRVRQPPSPGGPGGGGAGGHRPADTRLAHGPCALPGTPALIRHHLLLPHLQRPPEAVGEDHQCGGAAEPAALLCGESLAPREGGAGLDSHRTKSLSQQGQSPFEAMRGSGWYGEFVGESLLSWWGG